MRWNSMILTLVASVLLSFATSAQTDSLKKSDSSNAVLLQDYNQQLKEMKLREIQDSLRKAELERQLINIQPTDDKRINELQKELRDINEKETNWLREKKAKIDSLRATAVSFPVMGFFDDTLFVIYSRLGSFTAGDRASAITERINNLKNELIFTDSTLRLDSTESSVDISHGENIIMSISENDALWENTTKGELASKYRNRITADVLKYRKETSILTIVKEIALALLVIGVVWVLLLYTRKLFNWTAVKITEQEGKKITGLQIRNYTLFDQTKQVRFFLTVNTIVKWLVIILLVYIALPIIFGFFPWSQNFAQTLFGYVLNPLKTIATGILNYLPNLFAIIVIFLVFKYVIRGLRFLKREIEEGNLHVSGFYPDWANPTFQILRVILYAFMFVLIFPYLPGSDSPIFKGVSVFLGFLFTFGSAGSLSNIVAGIVLTYMRLFKLGDRVKIGDVTGDVIEKSMLVTRIRTIKNEIISIPNATVMSSHTINYSNEAETGGGLILYTTVTIGYDVPWKKMHQALLKAADKTEMLLKTPAPFVLQTSLDDFYVSYQINAYTKDPNNQAAIYSELHQNIQDCCNEAGIEIMSPHYRAARDGNPSTIPTSYLGDSYKSPGFKVNIRKEEE